MTESGAFDDARALLAPYTQSEATPEPVRLDVIIRLEDLRPAVGALRAAGWGYLAGITGLDNGVAAGTFEALYHFFRGPLVLTVRAPVPRAEPAVPSLYDLFPNASLYERELAEMFGITVTGLPDTAHLFLPDDWPADLFPLRKDADLAFSDKP